MATVRGTKEQRKVVWLQSPTFASSEFNMVGFGMPKASLRRILECHARWFCPIAEYSVPEFARIFRSLNLPEYFGCPIGFSTYIELIISTYIYCIGYATYNPMTCVQPGVPRTVRITLATRELGSVSLGFWYGSLFRKSLCRIYGVFF